MENIKGRCESKAMDCDGASSSKSSPAMELHKCRHFELFKREIGSLRPSMYAHRIGGCEDMVLRLKEYRRLHGHRGCVNTIHFNPAGDQLISGSDDKQIIIWDWMAGRKKLSYDSGHEHNVFQARAMPFTDDRNVVSCGADGQVRHGEILEDGTVITKKLGKHRGIAHRLAIEPGSPRTFFSCGEDGVVQHFDLRDNRRSELLTCRKQFKSRKSSIWLNSIVINPRNPNYIALGGGGVYARIYDLRKVDDGSPVSLYAPKHLTGFAHIYITGLAYSHQEELLVSYSSDKIYLFQKDMKIEESRSDFHWWEGEEEEEEYDDDDHDEEDLLDDDEENNSDSPDIEMVDPSSRNKDGNDEDDDEREDKDEDETAMEEGRSPQVYMGHVNSQTMKSVNFFGPSCEYVVSGSDCGHIFIWKKRGGELVKMLKGDRRVVNCLESHPYSAFLATSGMDKSIKLWAPTSPDRVPFPPNADKIMEKNRRGPRPLVIMHFQSAFDDVYRRDLLSRHSDDEEDEGFISSDEETDDSLGSPRECIIS